MPGTAPSETPGGMGSRGAQAPGLLLAMCPLARWSVTPAPSWCPARRGRPGPGPGGATAVAGGVVAAWATPSFAALSGKCHLHNLGGLRPWGAGRDPLGLRPATGLGSRQEGLADGGGLVTLGTHPAQEEGAARSDTRSAQGASEAAGQQLPEPRLRTLCGGGRCPAALWPGQCLTLGPSPAGAAAWPHR